MCVNGIHWHLVMHLKRNAIQYTSGAFIAGCKLAAKPERYSIMHALLARHSPLAKRQQWSGSSQMSWDWSRCPDASQPVNKSALPPHHQPYRVSRGTLLFSAQLSCSCTDSGVEGPSPGPCGWCWCWCWCAWPGLRRLPPAACVVLRFRVLAEDWWWLVCGGGRGGRRVDWLWWLDEPADRERRGERERGGRRRRRGKGWENTEGGVRFTHMTNYDQ